MDETNTNLENDNTEEDGSSTAPCSPTPETDAAVLQVNLCDADCPEAVPGEVIHPKFARRLERERDAALRREAAIRRFCEVEMGWEYFRADMRIVNTPTQSLANAKKLQEYLAENDQSVASLPGSTFLADMSKDERSLLLYLETRAVDHGGLVATPQMNADDYAILDRWKESGFVRSGRLTHASVEKLQGSTHWVRLSEEAWKLAHEERRARHERSYAAKTWETTEEKRGA